MNILNVLLLIGGYLLLVAGTAVLETGSLSLLRIRPTSDAAERMCSWLASGIFPFVILGITGGILGAGTMIFSAAIAAGVLELLLVFGMAGVTKNYSIRGNLLINAIMLFASVAVLIVATSYTWSSGHPAVQLGRAAGIVFIILAIALSVWTFRYFSEKSKVRKQSAPYNAVPSAIMAATGVAFAGLGSVFFINCTAKLAADLGISQSLFGFAVMGVLMSIPEYFRIFRLCCKADGRVNATRTFATGNVGMFLMIGLAAVISPVSVGWGGAVLLFLSIAAMIAFILIACYGRAVGKAKAAAFIAVYAIIFVVFMQYNI